MSEIFKVPMPSEPQEFTGERLTTEVTGQIQTEHYHRYFVAREYCRGKDVLDIASGEGYGSALLTQTARSVVGVEVDADTVEHARRAYNGPDFFVGDATSIPIADDSVDVVVSFETLEHLYDHDAFMKEVRRVLRPEGLLILSTPDRDLYFPPTGVNEYHVNELTRLELEALLKRYFAQTYLCFQRALLGSVLLLDPMATGNMAPIVFEKRNDTYFERTFGMPRAPYIVAFASDAPINVPAAAVYVERSEPYSHIAHMEEKFQTAEIAFHAEEERLRDELAQKMDELAQKTDELAQKTIEDTRLRDDLAQTTKLANTLKVREAELEARLNRLAPGRIVGALRRFLLRGK